MVVPVVAVDGPVVGTTWSSVHPALVGPGTAPATPGAWARTDHGACLLAGGHDHLERPRGSDPEGGGHLVVADPWRWPWPARW